MALKSCPRRSIIVSMRFEKTSQEEAEAQYSKFLKRPLTNEDKQVVAEALRDLPMPSRATEGSAGYDFYCPFDVELANVKNEPTSCSHLRIPLFIKLVDMPNRTVMFLFNRSSLSLKDHLTIDNCVGVIDSDYNLCVLVQISGPADRGRIEKGEKVIQGVITDFLVVDNDRVIEKERKGGLGSTGRK